MQKRPLRFVRVSHRQAREEEVSSKDLTRRELLSYLFTDFFRISYDVVAIFFDALILPEIYFLRPTGPVYSLYVQHYFGSEVYYMLYMYGVIALLETAAIWLQIKGYRKLWPKYYRLSGKK